MAYSISYDGADRYGGDKMKSCPAGRRADARRKRLRRLLIAKLLRDRREDEDEGEGIESEEGGEEPDTGRLARVWRSAGSRGKPAS